EKIRRAAEGNTDPARMREFSNQFGQFTSKPDRFVEVLKNVNPFAATTVSVRMAELRQTLFADSGLRGGSIGTKALRKLTTFSRGVGGTALALTLLNKMLSGRYPWQNEPDHRFDVNLGPDEDGRDRYVKLQALDPVASRVLNTFGAPELA